MRKLFSRRARGEDPIGLPGASSPGHAAASDAALGSAHSAESVSSLHAVPVVAANPRIGFLAGMDGEPEDHDDPGGDLQFLPPQRTAGSNNRSRGAGGSGGSLTSSAGARSRRLFSTEDAVPMPGATRLAGLFDEEEEEPDYGSAAANVQAAKAQYVGLRPSAATAPAVPATVPASVAAPAPATAVPSVAVPSAAPAPPSGQMPSHSIPKVERLSGEPVAALADASLVSADAGGEVAVGQLSLKERMARLGAPALGPSTALAQPAPIPPAPARGVNVQALGTAPDVASTPKPEGAGVAACAAAVAAAAAAGSGIAAGSVVPSGFHVGPPTSEGLSANGAPLPSADVQHVQYRLAQLQQQQQFEVPGLHGTTVTPSLATSPHPGGAGLEGVPPVATSARWTAPPMLAGTTPQVARSGGTEAGFSMAERVGGKLLDSDALGFTVSPAQQIKHPSADLIRDYWEAVRRTSGTPYAYLGALPIIPGLNSPGPAAAGCPHPAHGAASQVPPHSGGGMRPAEHPASSPLLAAGNAHAVPGGATTVGSMSLQQLVSAMRDVVRAEATPEGWQAERQKLERRISLLEEQLRAAKLHQEQVREGHRVQTSALHAQLAEMQMLAQEMREQQLRLEGERQKQEWERNAAHGAIELELHQCRSELQQARLEERGLRDRLADAEAAFQRSDAAAAAAAASVVALQQRLAETEQQAQLQLQQQMEQQQAQAAAEAASNAGAQATYRAAEQRTQEMSEVVEALRSALQTAMEARARDAAAACKNVLAIVFMGLQSSLPQRPGARVLVEALLARARSLCQRCGRATEGQLLRVAALDAATFTDKASVFSSSALASKAISIAAETLADRVDWEAEVIAAEPDGQVPEAPEEELKALRDEARHWEAQLAAADAQLKDAHIREAETRTREQNLMAENEKLREARADDPNRQLHEDALQALRDEARHWEAQFAARDAQLKDAHIREAEARTREQNLMAENEKLREARADDPNRQRHEAALQAVRDEARHWEAQFVAIDAQLKDAHTRDSEARTREQDLRAEIEKFRQTKVLEPDRHLHENAVLAPMVSQVPTMLGSEQQQQQQEQQLVPELQAHEQETSLHQPVVPLQSTGTSDRECHVLEQDPPAVGKERPEENGEWPADSQQDPPAVGVENYKEHDERLADSQPYPPAVGVENYKEHGERLADSQQDPLAVGEEKSEEHAERLEGSGVKDESGNDEKCHSVENDKDQREAGKEAWRDRAEEQHGESAHVESVKADDALRNEQGHVVFPAVKITSANRASLFSDDEDEAPSAAQGFQRSAAPLAQRSTLFSDDSDSADDGLFSKPAGTAHGAGVRSAGGGKGGGGSLGRTGAAPATGTRAKKASLFDDDSDSSFIC